MNFDGGKIVKWRQGDYEFAIRQMNPFYAMSVLGDLQKIIVPALGGAAGGVEQDAEQSEIVSAIGGMLKALSTSVDGKTLMQSAKLLLDSEYVSVKADGGKFVHADEDILATVYWGRPFDMVALCLKVFQVNYLDFTNSCSVPIGVQNAVNEIMSMVQEKSENNLEE